MKKFLCVADIHGDVHTLQIVREFVATYGIENAIIMGDFSSHGSFRYPEKNIEEIRRVLSIMSNFNLLAIPGNCDTKEVLDIFDEKKINLHCVKKEIENTVIAGFGGSNPTPFNTPFELQEEDIYKELESLLDGTQGKRVVLILHSPPKDTECDRIGDGSHVGSTAVRQIIEKYQPNLVLCSHVHESSGREDEINGSRIVNVGPVSDEKAAILRMGNDVSLTFMEI